MLLAGLTSAGKEPAKRQERLGVAGLALHYANLITQIDNIVSFSAELKRYGLHCLGLLRQFS